MTAADADLAADNARLRAELAAEGQRADAAEAREAAVAAVLDLLRTMSGDAQAILDGIAKQAVQLTASDNASLLILRDGRLLLVAGWYRLGHGPSVSLQTPEDSSVYLSSGSAGATALAESRTIAVAGGPDAIADEFPGSADAWRLFWRRDRIAVGSAVSVPLVRDGDGFGVLVVRRPSLAPYSAQQIALLEAFAAQAVIAMENARLFEETQQKTREVEERNTALTEALAHQQATSEVLTVISRSPTDLQAVLDAIVERAAQLLGSPIAAVAFFHGADMHAVSGIREGILQPSARLTGPAIWSGYLTPESIPGTVAREGRTVAVAGGSAVIRARFPLHARLQAQMRTLGRALPGSGVNVPLLRAGAVFGLISISRPSPEPYTAAQIALLETFAEQAVIAIENANLFSDLREALEQQTATTEILGIISSSPTDLQPVFQAVAERAQRLLSAEIAGVWLREGDDIHLVAEVGPTSRRALNKPLRTALEHDAPSAQAIREARTIHAHGTPREVERDHPRTAEEWRVAGFERRTVLYVPLLHDGGALGVMLVGRADGVPFTERQIALLETFAAQVVIAMQNTRLFNELQTSNAGLREALEQQTATSEILHAISASPMDPSRALTLIG
ncbi:MAG: GAF domain-containing protein [Dehalococcoidia bacterium]